MNILLFISCKRRKFLLPNFHSWFDCCNLLCSWLQTVFWTHKKLSTAYQKAMYCVRLLFPAQDNLLLSVIFVCLFVVVFVASSIQFQAAIDKLLNLIIFAKPPQYVWVSNNKGVLSERLLASPFFFLVRFRFISSSFCILCPTSYLISLFPSCFCCFSLRLKFIRYFTSEHDIFAYHLSSRLVYLHSLIIIFSLSPHSPAISQHLFAHHSFDAPILLFTSSRYMCPIFYFNHLWLLHVVSVSIY
jgi:hypothetical protein